MKILNIFSKAVLAVFLIYFNVSLTIASAPYTAEPLKLDQRFIVEVPATQEARTKLRKELLIYCTEQAPMHARLTFIDGVTMKTKAEFTIPALKYDSPYARMNKLRRELGALSQWLNQGSQEKQSSGGNKTARIPEILDRIAPTTSHTRIIYICNPIYRNARNDNASFVVNGMYVIPNVQNIKLSNEISPWGVIGKRHLNGAVIYFLYLAEEIFPNSTYSSRVKKYYDVYFKAAGGLGVYGFSSDGSNILSDMCQPLPVHNIIETPLPEPQAILNNVPVLSPEVQNIIQEFERQSEGFPMSAGICWDINADIDLWFVPATGSPVNFNNREHHQASYVHDKRDGSSGWEMINFKEVPDASTQLWANIYNIRVALHSDQQGLFFIRLKDRTVRGKFTIPVTRGDGSKGFDNRNANDNWIKIDWKPMLGSNS